MLITTEVGAVINLLPDFYESPDYALEEFKTMLEEFPCLCGAALAPACNCEMAGKIPLPSLISIIRLDIPEEVLAKGISSSEAVVKIEDLFYSQNETHLRN